MANGSHEPSALSHLSALWFERAEVPLARAHAKISAVLTHHFDLDLAPGAIRFLVGRVVAERVLRANLRDDFVVDAVELLDRRREERLPAGHFRDLRQFHALV